MAQENLRPLKILVFSMGMLLVGGTVFLAGVVWKKISAETAALEPGSKARCPGGKVDLKGLGPVADSAMEGGMLRLVLERDGGTEVVSIDLCRGEISSRVTVEVDRPPPVEENSYNKIGYDRAF